MGVNFRDVKKKDGLYGPTASGKYYLPNPVHNPTANPRKNKTRWIISEPHQYCLFEEADLNNRIAPDGLLGLHIIEGKLQILGENGEKLGFFPTPPNADEAWHGYPVKSQRLSDDFDEYFEEMLANNVILKRECSKLIRKQI